MQTHADFLSSEEILARRLMRLADRGALATLLARPSPEGEGGGPYASLVLVASDLDGSPLLMLSDLADHSRNIAADPRISLLLAPGSGAAEPLAEPRLSLSGEARPEPAERARQRFLDRHPGAAVYAGFGDFKCYRIACREAHQGPRLLLGSGAFALWPEGGNLARRMNVEEPGRIERLGGTAGGMAAPWRLTGIDPEGCDFRAGEKTARLDFPSAVESATQALDFIRKA
jgi:putative heme iron utilization protein